MITAAPIRVPRIYNENRCRITLVWRTSCRTRGCTARCQSPFLRGGPLRCGWNSIISDRLPCEHCPRVTPSRGERITARRSYLNCTRFRGEVITSFFLIPRLFRALKARRRNEFRAADLSSHPPPPPLSLLPAPHPPRPPPLKLNRPASNNART